VVAIILSKKDKVLPCEFFYLLNFVIQTDVMGKVNIMVQQIRDVLIMLITDLKIICEKLLEKYIYFMFN
jgi:hypothetical protein